MNNNVDFISIFSCHECGSEEKYKHPPKVAKLGLKKKGWIIPETINDKVYCDEECFEKNKHLYEEEDD